MSEKAKKAILIVAAILFVLLFFIFRDSVNIKIMFPVVTAMLITPVLIKFADLANHRKGVKNKTPKKVMSNAVKSTMNSDQIKNLMKKMEEIFIENGFAYVTLDNGRQYMCRNECYCRLEFSKGLNGIIIEAGDKREALLNIMEDADVYGCCLSENEILSLLREDMKYYIR